MNSLIIKLVLVGTVTLHQGFYTYKQLTKRGYYCKPFKGRHYIRPTSDTTKIDIFNIKMVKNGTVK